MLFEPTYVIPDVRNGLGNGVVNVDYNMSVSWRVNGQPYMVYYKIDIFTNDAASTLLYSTGKMTTYGPVYAYDADGNPNTFTVNILSSALTALSNGNSYKLQITQWWNANDFIVQSSPSVFLTRSRPSLDIDTFGDSVTPEEQTDGDPSDEEGDDETEEQKQALLDIVAQLAYTVPDGQDYVDALEDALYPDVTLSSITAVFVQAGMVVYDNGSLSQLRSNLTVTAIFSDGTSYPVTDYVLQGTLAPGNSTITVLYQGETTTFTVFVTAIPMIHTVNYTFSGTYSQAEHDTLNFIRWRIAVLGEEDNPIYDTGNLYGVSLLETTYYGFFDGVNYAIRLNGQTASGVNIDTGWIAFGVSYEMESIDSTLSATPICGGVNLNWTGLSYILGRAIGTATISDNDILEIADGAYVVWNTSNGTPLNLYPPLSFVFKGSFFGSINPARAYNSTTLFTIGQSPSSNNILLKANRELLYLTGPGFVWKIQQLPQIMSPEYSVKIIMTPQRWYAICKDISAQGRVEVKEIPAPLSIGNIKSVYAGGGAACAVDYVEVLHGTASDALIRQILADNETYEPEWKENNYLMANFSDGTLNAGRYSVSGEITGYDIYRRTLSDNTLTLAARLPIRDGATFYDYSVKNKQEPYEWRLFPVKKTGDDLTYQSASIVSNSVNVCFWSWMILEAAPTDNKNIFEVQAVYRFGKNLESGSGSNNNNPSVRANLTRYPTVSQATSQYQSGTLSSLIGVIDAERHYSDTIAMRDAIYNLSVSPNTLFLKNRKGDLLRIAISGPIGSITMDNTDQQAQNMTIPWVEVGPAQNVSLIGFSEM